MSSDLVERIRTHLVPLSQRLGDVGAGNPNNLEHWLSERTELYLSHVDDYLFDGIVYDAPFTLDEAVIGLLSLSELLDDAEIRQELLTAAMMVCCRAKVDRVIANDVLNLIVLPIQAIGIDSSLRQGIRRINHMP